jgi:phospholipid transport system substrate-binding protein
MENIMREVLRGSLPQQDLFLPIRRVSRLAVFASLGVALVGGGQPALAQSAAKGTEAEPLASPLPPLELVKSSMTRVLTLTQSRAAGPAASAQRRELRVVAAELFDFNEMSRRMLGAHWKEGTPEEQAEFVRLFTDLLERSYLTALGHYPLATISFEGELVNGPYALVNSRIAVGRRGESSLEYRLLETDGRWAVYDVAVDGVSLVLSYRSQFNSILRTSRFAQLLDRLRSGQAYVGPRGDEGY